MPRRVMIRSYRDTIREAGQAFRLAPGIDVRAALKRAALAAVPKVEDWTHHVFTIARTKEGERVIASLDRLARVAMGGSDFAADVATTLAGAPSFWLSWR